MSASREHRQRLYEQLVGTNVAGRFQITDLLGFGGMGAVYEAIQRNMERRVALKVIPSHDPTTAARFEREAQTISKLHHPNTVTVFDYGQTDEGLLFLAMEMLSGQTLSDCIGTRGVVTPNEAVHIAGQVCRSLDEAHQGGIVHRDVKPDNIFLVEVDEDPHFVKVLDFGIAKIVRGNEDVNLTGTNRIIGTPKYMSPEQILDEAIDHRSDIYSLACIVFEMLCGAPPFEDSSTTKLMIAHAHQAPPTFAERLPGDALARIPGPLEQVVRRGLSKSPSERQNDIADFRHELQDALEATDHALRVGELIEGATEVRRSPPVEGSPADGSPAESSPAGRDAASPEATDSKDLLSQHSSQSLPKQPLATGDRPAPAGAVADNAPAGSPTEHTEQTAGSSNRQLIYAIGALAAIIVALALYASFGASSDDPSLADIAPTKSPNVDPAGTNEAAQKRGPSKHATTDNAPAAKPQPPPASTIEIRVETDPDGAQVYEQGRYLGKTPMVIERSVGQTLTYRFERDGFSDKDASYTVDRDQPTFEVTLEPEHPTPADTPPHRAPRRRPRRAPPTPAAPARTPSPTKPASHGDNGGAGDSDTSSPEDDPDDSAPSIERLDDDGPKIDRL